MHMQTIMSYVQVQLFQLCQHVTFNAPKQQSVTLAPGYAEVKYYFT